MSQSQIPDCAGLLAAAFVCVLGACCAAADQATPAATQPGTVVLKWKDGKKAVFMLEFDDSIPTDVTNVAPELKKRGLAGIFYINPGRSQFQTLRTAWETQIPGPGIEYGNHTFSHVGATSVAQLDGELAKTNDEINKCYPGRPQPRLISFARPGGVPWKVSPDECKALLDKYHLIERPPFGGPPFLQKSVAEMLATVDQAIAKGEMGHMDFHGVGGDWLVTPLPWFTALLDKLEACRDQLWITDPISWHKYLTERKSASVQVLASDKDQIRIQISCAADPALYDMPLTLRTAVPPQWRRCLVVQGQTSTKVPAGDGAVRYDALPGPQEVSIKPVGDGD
jgi:peptidoglycan/xylan/chitin deacetylase (PgdA/CDA1 family)